MIGGYSLGRLAVLGVAHLGVVKVVNDLVASTAIRDTAVAGIRSKIGVFVIGSLVGEVVTRHVNGRIDQAIIVWQEQKAEIDAKVDEKVKEALAKKTEEK